GISVESHGSFCRLPHQKYGPRPQLASSSTRLVSGDCQFTRPRRFGWFSVVLCPSGEATNPVKVCPENEPPWMQCWQMYCSSTQPLILLRGVGCQVSRSDPFFHVPSSTTCSDKSGS